MFVGGEIFTENSSGIPTSALSDSSRFGKAYGETIALMSASTDESAVFTVEKISSLTSSEIYLPIPKANAELGELSNQRVSAILKQMCETDEPKVKKVTENRKTIFYLIALTNEKEETEE